MLERKKPDDERAERAEEDQPAAKPEPKRFFGISIKGIVYFAIAVVLVPCVAFLTHNAGLFGAGRHLGREVSLGRFHFLGANSPENRIARAEFDLHISLLNEVEGVARGLLQLPLPIRIGIPKG